MLMSARMRYRLSFDAKAFQVECCASGTARFSGRASQRGVPKLYIVSVDGRPIYVGITQQPMRSRLRFGWNATGKGGYYGYPWRHSLTRADLDLWCQEDATPGASQRDLETLEAEIVYLIRAAGQWPAHQTEIHFHPSSEQHRQAAAWIASHYDLKGATTAPSTGVDEEPDSLQSSSQITSNGVN